VNQTATFDFSLTVGEITQEITVAASGAEVQSSTAELGAVVAKQLIIDLPLNGRNFTQLLSLTHSQLPSPTLGRAEPTRLAAIPGTWGRNRTAATVRPVPARGERYA